MHGKWIWASAAIAAMWLAVLFVSLFGPLMVIESAAGDRIEIPAAAGMVTLFAFIATVVVAVRGFRADERGTVRAELEADRAPREQLEPTHAKAERETRPLARTG